MFVVAPWFGHLFKKTLKMFSLEKKEAPAKCMETLYRVNKHKLFVFWRASKTTQTVLQANEPDPRVLRVGSVQCRTAQWRVGADSQDCETVFHTQSPPGEPQTEPHICLSVINVVLFRTLTNVFLLLPPSPLRRHLPLASPPASCAPAVLGTCLNFLATSDLQMNCMLRSSSTKPLARSWTMPSTTWHLCRWPLAVSLCFAFRGPVSWALFSFLPCCCLWIMCLLLPSSCGESIKVCATPQLYVCHLLLHTNCHLCTTLKIYHMFVKSVFQFLL